MWKIYLSGEIHTNWRDELKTRAKEASLSVEFLGPETDHDLSDNFGANLQERQKYSHSVEGNSGPSEIPVSSQNSLKNPLINQQNRDSGASNNFSHHHHPGQNPYFNNMNPSFLCPPNNVNPHLTMENPENGSGSDPANIYGGVSMYSSTGQDNLNYDKVE